MDILFEIFFEIILEVIFSCFNSKRFPMWIRILFAVMFTIVGIVVVVGILSLGFQISKDNMAAGIFMILIGFALGIGLFIKCKNNFKHLKRNAELDVS